LRRVIDYG